MHKLDYALSSEMMCKLSSRKTYYYVEHPSRKIRRPKWLHQKALQTKPSESKAKLLTWRDLTTTPINILRCYYYSKYSI